MCCGLLVLQSAEFEEVKALKNPRYKDRAESRRQTVGSDGVFLRDDAPASVHVYVYQGIKDNFKFLLYYIY